jgi:hypothetical protein
MYKDPNGGKQKGSLYTIRKLTTMQRAETLTIIGSFHTSSTDSLNVHVSVLPMHLRIGKSFFRATVRIASLSDSHPLHSQYRKAGV